MKRFFVYFFITVVFGFLIFWGFKIPLMIKERYMFEAPLKVLMIFSTIFPIFIGVLLRLPQLIIEIKEKRKWSIDWVKLTAIGIPTLYVSQMLILYFFTPFGSSLPFGRILMQNADIPLPTIAGIIFGYIVLDSLKEDHESTKGELN
jgi:hypothetical protein